MDRTERVELTVMCMVYDERRILMQNREGRGRKWKGYALPGGHVEPGESFVEAVKREVREETGLAISSPVLCGVKQFPIEAGRYVVLLYKAKEFSGRLVSSEEGEMEWVDRDRLSEYELADDFPELLRVFEEDGLSEFRYTVEGEEWTVHLE